MVCVYIYIHTHAHTLPDHTSILASSAGAVQCIGASSAPSPTPLSIMSFWGAVVRAGEPYVVRPSGSGGRRLRVTQVTLGNFDHSGWVLVECNVGDQGLVKVAALNPETAPVCPLELEFEEDKNVVLSVHGQNSVHLSGYYICSYNGDHGENSKQATKEIEYNAIDGDASHGLEHILGGNVVQAANQVENASQTHEDNDAAHHSAQQTEPPILVLEDNGAAENNDGKQRDAAKQSKNVKAELHPHIRVLDLGHGENSKQATEEMESDAIDGDASLGLEHTLGGNVVQAVNQAENASQTHEDNDAAHHSTQQTEPPILVLEDNGAAENNDGKQRDAAKQSKNVKAELHPHIRVLDHGHGENSKQATQEMESDAIDGDASLGLEHTLGGNVVQAVNQAENASQTHEDNDAAHHSIQQTEPPILVLEDNGAAANNDGKQRDEAKQSKNVQAELHPHIRVLDSGMTIEDLADGNDDAKIASNGRKVYVKYICMLSNGDTVDPPGESSTCKFILGAGEVISAWDLGIEGMHVGGIRRLRVPPHLGYGDVGRGNIPPNSWLSYDIELLKVKRRRKARKVKRARRVAPQTSTAC